jgi:hypothetical protein
VRPLWRATPLSMLQNLDFRVRGVELLKSNAFLDP